MAPDAWNAGCLSKGDFLRMYLADRDVSCPVCGHALRGLAVSSCPNCLSPLELRIGGSRAPVVQFIMMVAPALMFSGLVVWATLVLVQIGLRPAQLGWLVPLAPGWLELALIPLTLRKRRAFYTWSARARITAIAAVWVVNAALLGVFVSVLQ